MRPGIIIQHAREISRDGGIVRSDVTGFIGVVPKDRWPKNVARGDFFELPLKSLAELLSNPLRHLVDSATRRAVQSFYENGGQQCRLFGLFIESQDDLMVDDPFSVLFSALLDRLRGQEDIGLLSMPVLAYLPTEVVRRDVIVRHDPVLDLLLAHCREMNNRFLLIDTPRDLHDEPLQRWVRRFRVRNAPAASYGAIYYPWLMNGDEEFPPTGSIAGVYARVEREHAPFGVAWPPANEILKGVTHPAFPVRWSETGAMAEAGINPILDQPSRGVVIWGARTMSAEPNWLYINTRRVVSFVSEQIKRDAEWVVFENQTPELWSIITRMVSARLDEFWGAGLLSGELASSSYYIQCDDELNPPEVRDAGLINVMVLLRPVTTAETIVVELRLGGD